MKFYAPENLDLNKLSAPLAHKVINFFVDKIKELKHQEDINNCNNFEQFVLDDFDLIEDTFLVSAKEFNTEKYKNLNLNELTPELKNLISYEIHYFLKDADDDLQKELEPFIQSSEPTEIYYYYNGNNGRIEILSADELEYDTDSLRGKYIINGNEILNGSSRAHPRSHNSFDVFKILDTCKEAEQFILDQINDNYDASGVDCCITSSPEEMKDYLKATILDSMDEPDEEIQEYYNNLIKEFDDDLKKLNQHENQAQSVNLGKGFKR